MASVSMMFIVCLLTFLCYSETSGNYITNKTCGRNEVWTDHGTLCPLSCKTRGALIKCVADPYIGCECTEQTIRLYINGNEKGPCIDPSECPPKCH